MSKVYMKAKISGTRDGAAWPNRGDAIDLPDDEADQLVASGIASHKPFDTTPGPIVGSSVEPEEAVAEPDPEEVEAAVEPVEAETADVDTKPRRGRDASAKVLKN